MAQNQRYVFMRAPWFSLLQVAVILSFVSLTFTVDLQAQIADFENVDFGKADSVAALYSNHPLTNLKSLADKLTIPLPTEVEQFRAVYRWVCDNIENDYGLYVKNKYKREMLNDHPEKLNQWNQKFNPRVFKKLFYEHKTVCTGYAYLVKELAYHAGITCVIVDGYGRTAQANIGGPGIANHSWNAVKLNNEWYLCDATWSSGSIDPRQAQFIKRFSEAYFLAEPTLFIRNHYPLDTTWILSDQKSTLQEFLEGPLIYKESFHNAVVPLFPKSFYVTATAGSPVAFKFSKKDDQQNKVLELLIIQGDTHQSSYPEVHQDTSGVYGFDHVFWSKGTYIVHLRLQDDYVITYEVTIKK